MPATLVMEFGKCLQVVALGQCDIEVKLGKGIAVVLLTREYGNAQS
jgi:hypothetical protein